MLRRDPEDEADKLLRNGVNQAATLKATRCHIAPLMALQKAFKYTTCISSQSLYLISYMIWPSFKHSIHLAWHQQPSPAALAGRGTRLSKGSSLAARPSPLLVSQQQGCFIGPPLGSRGRPFGSTAAGRSLKHRVNSSSPPILFQHRSTLCMYLYSRGSFPPSGLLQGLQRSSSPALAQIQWNGTLNLSATGRLS